jgi:hypothetical protein
MTKQTQEQGRTNALSLDDALKLVNPKRESMRWEKFDRTKATFYGEVVEDPSIKVELKQNGCMIYAEVEVGCYFGEVMESRKPLLARYTDSRFTKAYDFLTSGFDRDESEEIKHHIRNLKEIVGRT